MTHPIGMSNPTDELAIGPKTYRSPWKGQIVLVCRKCEKKLRHGGKKNKLARLGKELKKRTKRNEESQQLRVIPVSCLKMCPKDGVTVCTQQQLSRNQCSIVRTRGDIDSLISQSQSE